MSCSHCVYYESTSALDVFEGYCIHLQAKVSSFGSCKHYSEAPTKSNSEYSSGCCFLTSACVRYMGKADDCKELTVLRGFRDTYMKETPERRALIDEYYKIAPEIVNNIEQSPEKNTFYSYIYKTVVRCVDLISHDENEQALAEYKNIVKVLQNDLVKKSKSL